MVFDKIKEGYEPTMEEFSKAVYTKTYKSFDEFCNVFHTFDDLVIWFHANRIEWPKYDTYSREDALNYTGPVTWPDEFLKTKTGVCFDHALFAYMFCKRNDIPAKIYRFSRFYNLAKTKMETTLYCSSHFVTLVKRKFGYWMFSYSGTGSDTAGPFDTEKDFTKWFSKRFAETFEMMTAVNDKIKYHMNVLPESITNNKFPTDFPDYNNRYIIRYGAFTDKDMGFILSNIGNKRITINEFVEKSDGCHFDEDKKVIKHSLLDVIRNNFRATVGKSANKIYRFFTDNRKSIKEDFAPVSESLLFSDDDYSHNYDKWLNGENKILYIVGLSGSGKTTLANKLAKHEKCRVIHVDDVHHDVAKKLGKNWKINYSRKERRDILWNEVLNQINREPDKVIVDGGFLVIDNVPDIKNKSLIIPGTSAITASFRMIKRTLSFDSKQGLPAIFREFRGRSKLDMLIRMITLIYRNISNNITNDNRLSILKESYIGDESMNIVNEFLFDNKKKEEAFVPQKGKPFPGTKAEYTKYLNKYIDNKHKGSHTLEYLWEIEVFDYDERTCINIAKHNTDIESRYILCDVDNESANAVIRKEREYFKDKGLGVLIDTDGYGYVYSSVLRKWFEYDHEATPQVNSKKPVSFSAIKAKAKQYYNEEMSDYDVPSSTTESYTGGSHFVTEGAAVNWNSQQKDAIYAEFRKYFESSKYKKELILIGKGLSLRIFNSPMFAVIYTRPGFDGDKDDILALCKEASKKSKKYNFVRQKIGLPQAAHFISDHHPLSIPYPNLQYGIVALPKNASLIGYESTVPSDVNTSRFVTESIGQGTYDYPLNTLNVKKFSSVLPALRNAKIGKGYRGLIHAKLEQPVAHPVAFVNIELKTGNVQTSHGDPVWIGKAKAKIIAHAPKVTKESYNHFVTEETALKNPYNRYGNIKTTRRVDHKQAVRHPSTIKKYVDSHENYTDFF